MTDLKQLLKDNGVVGAGGAGFPSYCKLAEGADTLLINAVECEPLLYTEPTAEMRERAAEIATVVRSLGKDALKVEEPRFGFMHDFEKLQLPANSKKGTFIDNVDTATDNNEAFELRMIFPYFSDFGDPLLDENDGVSTGLLCGFHLLQYIGHIPGSTILHLLVVPRKVFDWVFSRESERQLQAVFAERVGITTLGSVVTAFVLVVLAQPRRRRAVEPTV